MPPRGFVQTKKELQRLYAEKGQPISSRQAHRLAQGIMLAEFAEEAWKSADQEEYSRKFKDETGEAAIKNVILRDFLRDYHTSKELPQHPEQENGPGTVAKQCSEAA